MAKAKVSPVSPEIPLEFTDISRQKRFTVKNAPADGTVGALVNEMIGKMNLPRNDGSGRPLNYHARLEREGRHLHASELIGDALQTGDRLTMQPDIIAGLG